LRAELWLPILNAELAIALQDARISGGYCIDQKTRIPQIYRVVRNVVAKVGFAITSFEIYL
jgi:hypothetical protein